MSGLGESTATTAAPDSAVFILHVNARELLVVYLAIGFLAVFGLCGFVQFLHLRAWRRRLIAAQRQLVKEQAKAQTAPHEGAPVVNHQLPPSALGARLEPILGALPRL